jgi:hypothetical protein
MDAMTMADSVNIWAGLMDFRMYQEAGSVYGQGLIAANDLALVVDEDHIINPEKAKVNPQRVCPKSMRIFRVPYRNMPTHAFNIAFAGPMSENSRHMLQEPLALGREVEKLWDPSEHWTMAQCPQRCKGFTLVKKARSGLCTMIAP